VLAKQQILYLLSHTSSLTIRFLIKWHVSGFCLTFKNSITFPLPHIPYYSSLTYSALQHLPKFETLLLLILFTNKVLSL
jgi:hypothetical protein